MKTLALGPSRRLFVAICNFDPEVISVVIERHDMPHVQYNLHRTEHLFNVVHTGDVYPDVTTYRRCRNYINQRRKLLEVLLHTYEFTGEEVDQLFMAINIHAGLWEKGAAL